MSNNIDRLHVIGTASQLTGFVEAAKDVLLGRNPERYNVEDLSELKGAIREASVEFSVILEQAVGELKANEEKE